MLPFRCQSLSKFACKPHKYWVCSHWLIIPTLKLKLGSIQFCMGHMVLFDFIYFLLSYIYGLFQIMLSNCYQSSVITLFFYFIFANLSIAFEKLFIISSMSPFSTPLEIQYFKWLSKMACPALCKADFSTLIQ